MLAPLAYSCFGGSECQAAQQLIEFFEENASVRRF